MKHILCPTDFSTVADNAIVFAAKLSKRLGATLHLTNVQRLADLTPEEALLGRDMNVSSAQEVIDAHSLEVSKVFKISCYGEATPSTLSLSGELARNVTSYDLVVMGTNGEDEFAQYLLGSNTYQLINKTRIPVLAVPEGCTYRDIRTIVYAFDYWRSDELVLAQVVSLAEKLGSNLVILQVMEASFSAKADAEIKHLQALILEVYGDRVPITFALVHDDKTSDAIDNYFTQGNADMLAICAQHHGFPAGLFRRGVVRAITDKADYPVMVFHR